MGFFSWMFADTANKERLMIGSPGYLLVPEGKGENIYESCYEGYGCFGCQDVYELVAIWNREYLAEHPEHLLNSGSRTVDLADWYRYYADMSISLEEAVEKWKCDVGYDVELREIGIDIAHAWDNMRLPFPIKVAKVNVPYESVSDASEEDMLQGCL